MIKVVHCWFSIETALIFLTDVTVEMKHLWGDESSHSDQREAEPWRFSGVTLR